MNAPGLPAALARFDTATLGQLVQDHQDHWLVKDCVAFREGVNDNGQYKPFSAFQDAAARHKDAAVPFIWLHAHPKGAAFQDGDWDKRTAAGIAVNWRADATRRALVYDLRLFKTRPEGMATSDEDLARNGRTVGLVKAGGVVNNSPGYNAIALPLAGEAAGVDGSPASYREYQAKITLIDHVAGLAPIAGGPGACPAPVCGIGHVDNQEDQAMDPISASKLTRLSAALREFFLPDVRAEAQAAVDECAKKHLGAARKDQENDTMDAKEVAALVDKAVSEKLPAAVTDALKPIQEQLKPLGELKGFGDSLKELQRQNDERARLEKARVDQEYDATLTKVAMLRVGRTDEAKLKAEKERLGKALTTKAALDEHLALLQQPGVVDPTILRGPPATAGPYGQDAQGNWTVQDDEKVPLPAGSRKGVGQ